MTTSTALPSLGTVQSRSELLESIGSTTRRASALRPAGGGPIVGLALTRQKNPDAPRSVVISGSPRARAEADQMVDAAQPLPIWLRDRPGGGWTFVGRWRPTTVDTSTAGNLAGPGGADRIDDVDDGVSPAAVLRLQPVGQVLDESRD